MNLNEVVDHSFGLQEDEWSLTSPSFGEGGCLEVVGWSGYLFSYKIYILKCHKCSDDPELFGGGYFKSIKSNLAKGQIPCGCSKSFRRDKDQWRILSKRKAEQIDCVLDEITWVTDSSKKAVTHLSCEQHGKFSRTLDSLINNPYGCPECGKQKVVAASKQDDSDAISEFMGTGSYHPNTKFWRSNRADSKGKFSYWNIHCPMCNEVSEILGSSLKKGSIPCNCRLSRQTKAYIHLVSDGGTPIALKVGISTNPERRIYEQQRRSKLKLSNVGVWEFPSKAHCRRAETFCKQEFVCGVVDQQLMPDGYTETISLSNLERVIEIMKSCGGVSFTL